jgi:hypothetical protein
MSIIAFPGPDRSECCAGENLSSERPARSRQPVRRRGSLEQGRALETLGHAVEYLVDSRLFQSGDHNQRDEVVSLRRRLGRWAAERFVSGGGLVA